MNVLAAGFSRLVKPSRGQDPYSCNVGEFCTAPVFFYTVSLSVSIFQSYALPILPAPPDSPSNPQNQAPGWGPKAEKKPDLLSSSPHAFFSVIPTFHFSHTGLDTRTPPSLFWSCWVISTISPTGPHYSFSSCPSTFFPLSVTTHPLPPFQSLTSLSLPWGKLTFVHSLWPPWVLGLCASSHDWHVKPLSLVPWLSLTSLTSLLAGG